MRKSVTAVAVFLFSCSTLAFSQTYTISPFAGSTLPVNIPGTGASLGGLGQQTGYSVGNYTGALGRVAVDALGNLYFVAYNAVLQLNASTGNLSLVAGNGTIGFSGDNGPATTAQLNSPFGIALDAAGNLYISDAGNFRIRKVTNGVISTIAGNGTAGFSGDNGSAILAQFIQPAGLVVDTNQNVYVADQGNGRVRKISGGIITTIAGGGSSLGDSGQATSAQLVQPMGLAADTNGNLYIDDRQGNRIRKVASNGIITTVAGNGTLGFSGDTGAATSAEIGLPSDVSVDPAGNIYIADTANLRIRKVSGGMITTISGNGSQGFTTSGTATGAEFWQPAGVAADSLGNLYISDTLNNRISKIAGGNISIVVGGGASIGDNNPSTDSQLGYPPGLAVDSTGNVYIADQINQRIRKVSGSAITTVAGGGSSLGDSGPPASAQLFQPEGVALDSTGNLYIADTAAGRIRKIANGVITTIAGNGTLGYSGDGGVATNAALGWPVGVAVDSNGNVYIADYYSGRVREVASGVITTVAGGGTSSSDGIAATTAEISPAGVAVDSAGNLYIADQLNRKIRKVVNGTITTVAGNGSVVFSGDGGPPTSAGMGPVGVAVDSAGNIYIADQYNNRIRKVSSGTITTIAGNGTEGFAGDGGPGPSAQLALPEGVAVDSAGNVYVADTGNNRVRILAPSSTASCTYSAGPGSLQPTTAGGSFPITLTTGASCAWSVTGLPSWITVSGASSGIGPAIITLVVAANTGVAQNATVSIAGVSIVINQAGIAACTYSLSPTSLQPSSTGGNFPIGITTGAGCAWGVTGLPSWITVSGAASGSGPGTLTLVVAADSGSPQSTVITIGGVALPVNQANSSGAICVYALNAGGEAFAAAGGNGTFTVTTTSGCSWTASSAATWITSASTGTGNGTVTYAVGANTGSARVGTITILGLSYTVEEGASSISGFTSAGSMPDLTVAGDWTTSMTLVNPSATATLIRLSFFDDNGNPLTLPLTFPQSPSAAGPLLAASIDRTLNPGAVLEITSTGPALQATVTGWAQLLASGSANGFASFRYTVGSLDHQALIPLENRNGTDFLLAYDNTGGFADGVAVANSGSQAASIGITIRDDTGSFLFSGTISLAAMGSTSFVLPSSYGFTAGGRGTVELDGPAAGQISVMGIEYNTATGGFSTIPALVKQ